MKGGGGGVNLFSRDSSDLTRSVYGNICLSLSKYIFWYSHYSHTCKYSGKIQVNFCTAQFNTKYQFTRTTSTYIQNFAPS